jgi:hypothetical protein
VGRDEALRRFGRSIVQDARFRTWVIAGLILEEAAENIGKPLAQDRVLGRVLSSGQFRPRMSRGSAQHG